VPKLTLIIAEQSGAIKNNQQGRTKGMTGAEAVGCAMGRLAGLLFRPHNPPRAAHRFNL